MIPEVPSSRFVKNAEVSREEQNIKNRGRNKNITLQCSAEVGMEEKTVCCIMAEWKWPRLQTQSLRSCSQFYH